MKHNSTTQIGQTGESLVCDKLVKQGFTILARNVREKFAEIDIVALENSTDILVFIEVRTRKTRQLGHPAETITSKKMNQIRRAATAYMIKNKVHNKAVRFDVATIIWEEKKFEYFENAF
ncbi:MAG: YraN family protein [Deltaproteobacteria bacterium]|nr:YraN family protein [Deltaproteobacteria bacterium]